MAIKKMSPNMFFLLNLDIIQTKIEHRPLFYFTPLFTRGVLFTNLITFPHTTAEIVSYYVALINNDTPLEIKHKQV